MKLNKVQSSTIQSLIDTNIHTMQYICTQKYRWESEIQGVKERRRNKSGERKRGKTKMSGESGGGQKCWGIEGNKVMIKRGWKKERKEKGKVVRKSGESSKRMREKRSKRKSSARQVVKKKGRQVINEREEQKCWEEEKDAIVKGWR